MYKIILCGLFCAMTAVCSIFSLPLPFSPVPVSLATFAVFLAGGLLGAKYGALSQTVYLLLGAVGVPIFHNFTGGLGILTGPTGGYLVGYIAMAFICGLFCPQILKKSSFSKGKNFILIGAALLAANFLCYALGTLWFMFVSGTNAAAAIVTCVLPFIPADLFKIAAADFLLMRLFPVVNKLYLK